MKHVHGFKVQDLGVFEGNFYSIFKFILEKLPGTIVSEEGLTQLIRVLAEDHTSAIDSTTTCYVGATFHLKFATEILEESLSQESEHLRKLQLQTAETAAPIPVFVPFQSLDQLSMKPFFCNPGTNYPV